MLHITTQPSLQSLHTFHLPAKAQWHAEYHTLDELNELLDMPLLQENIFMHIGGGSNLLFVADYKGVLIHSAMQGYEVLKESESSVTLKVANGVVWDDFVAYCVAHNWSGVENLSGIPGEVGAAAIQNIGAYGVEAKESITAVHAIEYATRQTHIFDIKACQYGYRKSIFKESLRGKYVVTAVEFTLHKQHAPLLSYGNLAARVSALGDISLANIRRAIIEIRNEKLPDPARQGNAGSFFMNPVIPRNQYESLRREYPTIPCYPLTEAEVKVPAAWLIETCGLKGESIGGAAVDKRQPLVIVNTGNATAEEVVELAQLIQYTVSEKFGINLLPEVNFIR